VNRFERRGPELLCEEVPLRELADRFGTPLYVYSHATLTRHYTVFDAAFQGFPHLVCFAVKANPSLAILKVLAGQGSGADVVSGGELFRALRAGIPADRIVYSGAGKTTAEIEQALRARILMFNIESFQELEALDAAAGRLDQKARVSLRINPDVDPKTHPYVSTGLKTSKFGIDVSSALEGYSRAARLAHIEVAGVDCHIGSQLTELGPFVEAVSRLKGLVTDLRRAGHDIRYLDLGGGLGITYNEEEPPSPAQYGEAIRDALQGESLTLILEPGRNLVGNAGILLCRVLYTKDTDEKRFVIVDAGMNDLIRPSLYGSYHAIQPVLETGRKIGIFDVVGPICESGDFFARNRELPELEPGDRVAIMSAGAYGFSMASTYNSRPLAAEVMVRGTEAWLIRERGTCEDLVRGESVVPAGS